MTDKYCGLCGLQGTEFQTAEEEQVDLHVGQRTVVVDTDWIGLPIYTTCYDAWTVYGHRPHGERDSMAERCYNESCWKWVTGASDYCSQECERLMEP